MPTGNTAGIIDGTITTFEQFGTKCIRAYIMHMRDDPWDKEYYPEKPSNYHKKRVAQAKRDLGLLNAISDEGLIAQRKKEILKGIQGCKDDMEKTANNRKALNKMLTDATRYVIPTTAHQGIKKFMIEQLTTTIDYDGDASYSIKRMDELNKELKQPFDANKMRAERVKELTDDIQRDTAKSIEDIERCNDRNKWANDFFKSIKDED